MGKIRGNTLGSKKGFKNLIFGVWAQVITIGMGILIPRLVLVNLGSEANGLMSSVSSVLSYMTLLEAGVGTATVQALYKPFGESDRDGINGIMAATDYFYKKTGCIYLCFVVILSVVYTVFVETSISKTSVFLVVIMAGMSGVLSYFFQGKYKLFLIAEGKNYVITNISTIITVGVNLSKVLALVAGGNVVLIQSIYFLFNFIQMMVLLAYMKKNYSWINLKVEPNYGAISQKKAVLIHQVTELIFNNTDVIVLTAFTSLKTVSVYSMYAMIFGMVKAVAVVFSDSFSYMLGQSYNDKKRFHKLFNAYEIYNMAITFAFFCVASILMLPFLKLYTNGINDINYIDPYVLWLFVTFYLLQNGRKASQTVINIAQHFEKTKWRTVTEAIINLVCSVILTAKLGIYGVLWGTVLALLYRTNDVIFYTAKLLERSPMVTYRRWMTNIATFCGLIYVASLFSFEADNYVVLFIDGCVLVCIVVPLFLFVNSVLEKKYVKYLFEILKKKIQQRRK